jgi:hypothetical protein
MFSTKQDKGFEICVFERIAIPDDNKNFMLLELKIFQYKRSWMFMSSV